MSYISDTDLEVVLITLDADVVSFNNTTKTWQPFGDKCNVTISNDPELNYVKILVKSNNNILLNNAINAKLKYNEATPNFHQWRDSTGIYGIKFQNETHASNFASKIKEAMIISSTPPVSKISGNTTATVKTQMSYRSAPPPPPSSRAPVPSSTGLPPAPPVPPAPIAPPASIPSFTPGSIPAPPPCPPGGIPAPPPLVAPSQSSSVAVDGDLSSALLSVKLKKSQPLSETSIVSNSSSAAAPPVQSSGGGGGDLLSEMARKLANRQEAMAKKLTNEAPSVDNSSSNSSQPVQSTNQSLNRNPSFLPKNQNQPNTTLKKNDGNSSAKNSPTTNCISANLNLNTPILTSEMKKELITNVNQMIDQFRTQLIEVINKFPSQ